MSEKMKQLKSSYDNKLSLVWSPLNMYFGPNYPFFRNPEPWPTLRAWQVHFDQTRILKLEGSFLEEFSPTWHRSFLFTKTSRWINHPFWMNFEFLSAWWNNQMEKNEALGWKPRMGQSRVKTKVWKCSLLVIERQEGQCKSTKAFNKIQRAKP